jgi:hypothetical protein
MSQNNLYANKQLINFFDAFFASIGIIMIFLSALEFLPIGVYNYDIEILQLTWHDLLFIAIGIAYMLYAKFLTKRGSFNSEKAHALLLAIIRYSLAAGISSYGFSKLMGGQMASPGLPIRDAKISDLLDSWLTFYYFGLSRPFVMVIAAIEIIGPFLLLFRRTILVGVLLTLPAMVTIFLLNFFYHIGRGALVNSGFYTAGLIYLFLLQWQQVKEFIIRSRYDALPKTGSNLVKAIIRIALLLFVFMGAYQWNLRYPEYHKPGDPDLLGKWNVDQRFVNGTLTPNDAWEKDENIWSIFYFNNAVQFAYSNNPYYYTSKTGAVSGYYKFDKQNKILQLNFFATHDSLVSHIKMFKDDKLVLKGLFKNDTIILNLTRVKKIEN